MGPRKSSAGDWRQSRTRVSSSGFLASWPSACFSPTKSFESRARGRRRDGCAPLRPPRRMEMPETVALRIFGAGQDATQSGPKRCVEDGRGAGAGVQGTTVRRWSNSLGGAPASDVPDRPPRSPADAAGSRPHDLPCYDRNEYSMLATGLDLLRKCLDLFLPDFARRSPLFHSVPFSRPRTRFPC